MQALDGQAAKNRQGDARTLQRMAREQWAKAHSSVDVGQRPSVVKCRNSAANPHPHQPCRPIAGSEAWIVDPGSVRTAVICGSEHIDLVSGFSRR